MHPSMGVTNLQMQMRMRDDEHGGCDDAHDDDGEKDTHMWTRAGCVTRTAAWTHTDADEQELELERWRWKPAMRSNSIVTPVPV